MIEVITTDNCFNSNKSFRMLNIYERLNKGERIIKEQLAAEYGVSAKSIQRDIDDLRAYIAEAHSDEIEASIVYDKSSNSYSLVHFEREWLTNEEAVALCKILLESRAFEKGELSVLIDKIITQISPADRPAAENVIRSELVNYVPLRHGKKLLPIIWEITGYIKEQRVISFEYIRQDGRVSSKTVKPVSIMFSEFYFYMIAFSADDEVKHPI
ncbi:MAG: WYL domain-containing protein, partial [Clostridia bacterium]|nr:WYL domain-containing protein [Clostridia bacterium]